MQSFSVIKLIASYVDNWKWFLFFTILPDCIAQTSKWLMEQLLNRLIDNENNY